MWIECPLSSSGETIWLEGFQAPNGKNMTPPKNLPVESPKSTPSAPNVKTGRDPSTSGVGLLDEVVSKSAVMTEAPSQEEEPSLQEKVKTLIIGKPHDLRDRKVFQHIALAAFFAWVGLGADGLSSSCYGPSEAFINLKEHTYLAVFLAAATIVTVLVISACYSHIIEVFPSGGGGYLVASKLLGERVGLVAGSALFVDYVFTITVSIAAAGEALFGLFPAHGAAWKLPAEVAAIVLLTLLNLRGVKESVKVLLPIFLLFLLTHIVLVFGAVGLHVGDLGGVVSTVSSGLQADLANPAIGMLGLLTIFLYAYSLGAGTYTGIEAVSNSMAVMQEPRVATGQRTMLYMAISLALMAGGLLLAYLLLRIEPAHGKTMNQLLTERFVADVGLGTGAAGKAFILATILSEGALLVVAAQAGFIGGPRLMANMALDSWMPHPFQNFSERLATHNGVMVMGLCAIGALLATGGNVHALVIMYSINVFLTFSLSMLGMCKYWVKIRHRHPLRARRLTLFVCGALLCVSILCVTVFEKFFSGGWKTLAVTGGVIVLGLLIRRYYRGVSARLKKLNEIMTHVPPQGNASPPAPDPNDPTAVVLVGGYNGLGMHTLLNAYRFTPGYFKNVLFISVGVVDSGSFKGAETLDELREHTEKSLGKYVDVVRGWGVPSKSYMAIGTDAVEELEKLCVHILKEYPRTVFFAGQLVFQKDTWYQRILHNQTAFALLRRLQWDRVPMVILPTRVQ